MKESDIQIGKKVRVTQLGETTGMCIHQRNLEVRAVGVLGTIDGFVPGHGGDVLWVKHQDGKIGAYSFEELEVIG